MPGDNVLRSKRTLRTHHIIDALPLGNGMRILEIGCGTGVAAREILRQFNDCYILALDRSAKMIEMAIARSGNEIATGKLHFIQSTIEDFELPANEPLFDIAFAVRVGTLDGRHPYKEQLAFFKIWKSLKKDGMLFVDGEPTRNL